MTPVVLSFGGGVNSAAVLTYHLRTRRRLDLVVFADTGDESAETLAVVEHARALCKASGVRFEIVSRGDLVAWHQENRVVPLPHRGFRACTQKFKVAPIRRLLRSLGMTEAVVLVGIAWDEAHRVRNSDVAWLTNAFPLIDLRWTRADCEKELAQHWTGPPVVKSGCRGCPFIGEAGFLHLARTDPAEFERWNQMEKAARDYPENRLFVGGSTLAEIATRARTERTLAGWTRPAFECMAGACQPTPANLAGRDD